MARRVLDNISISALNKQGDEELTKQVEEMFGIGTEVEEPMTPKFYFNKSMLGLTKTNIANTIRKLAKELPTGDGASIVKDSKGGVHEVSKEAISILKAISLYRITCQRVVSDSITEVLDEIDRYFIKGKVGSIEVISINEDGKVKKEVDKKLTEVCRKELYPLLREVGVDIE